MSMSKRDYQAIARAIHAVNPKDDAGLSARIVWEGCVDALADVMAEDNGRFDRARFVEACETGHTKGMPR